MSSLLTKLFASENFVRLESCFAEIPDPQVQSRAAHSLRTIIVIAFCAAIGGANDFVAMDRTAWDNAVKRGDQAQMSLLLDTYRQKFVESLPPLHKAVCKGLLDSVKFFIAAGDDPNLKDRYGRTPLRYAVFNGDLTVVQFLLDCGANVNVEERRGVTPLHLAACNGNKEIVQLLLESGTDVNMQGYEGGYTPLHNAACNGNLAVVQLLLDYGANANAGDYMSWPPMRAAYDNNHQDVFLFLKEICKKRMHAAIVAFCMGCHPRTGQNSPILALPREMLETIIGYLTPDDFAMLNVILRRQTKTHQAGWTCIIN